MSWLESKAYDDWKTTPPEPKESKFRCTCCDEEIYPDDKYWNIEGEKYCYACARDWFEDQMCVATWEQCYER